MPAIDNSMIYSSLSLCPEVTPEVEVATDSRTGFWEL